MIWSAGSSTHQIGVVEKGTAKSLEVLHSRHSFTLLCFSLIANYTVRSFWFASLDVVVSLVLILPSDNDQLLPEVIPKEYFVHSALHFTSCTFSAKLF